MDTSESGRAAVHPVATIYGFGCFATLGSMTLTEQFADLPAAAVALASGWYILTLNSRPDP